MWLVVWAKKKFSCLKITLNAIPIAIRWNPTINVYAPIDCNPLPFSNSLGNFDSGYMLHLLWWLHDTILLMKSKNLIK